MKTINGHHMPDLEAGMVTKIVHISSKPNIKYLEIIIIYSNKHNIHDQKQIQTCLKLEMEA